MSASIFWRAAALQAASVAVLAVVLALALPHSFFENWGRFAGPASWALCAVLTARVLGLAVGMTLLGAAVAGAPSLIAVLAGLHWLGAAIAVLVFAAWCARLPGREAAWS
ncbi:MAG: hypothetical protein U0R52_04455 [Solirubrobacterales bacterium]